MRRSTPRLLARLAAGRPAVASFPTSASTSRAWPVAAAAAVTPTHTTSRTWASSATSSPSPPPPPPTCWSCGGAPTTPPPVIFCGLCAIIQPPCPHSDHFAILGVPRTFDLDMSALEAAHRRLQVVAHPDRFARASHPERTHSAALSARANAAFSVLKSPLTRARYMLGGTVDGEAEDESTSAANPALLMEVMEAREVIAEADPGSPELAALKEKYAQRVAALVEELSAAFKAGDTEAAHEASVRLRYATRIQQAITDKA